MRQKRPLNESTETSNEDRVIRKTLSKKGRQKVSKADLLKQYQDFSDAFGWDEQNKID